MKNLRSPAPTPNAPKEDLLGKPPMVNNLSENEERLDTKRDGNEPIAWPQGGGVDGVDHKPMKLKNGGE